jgi:hypothetical protein
MQTPTYATLVTAYLNTGGKVTTCLPATAKGAGKVWRKVWLQPSQTGRNTQGAKGTAPA